MSGKTDMRAARLIVGLATAGGVGSLAAPGTWGSVAGLAVGVLIDWSLESALAISVVGAVTFLLAVWICHRAEALLGRHDPPVVVLDELWAMAAVVLAVPAAEASAGLLAAAFGLFRVFDVLKPPPIRWLARQPGGWGIMADDVGAGAYTCAILCLIQWLRRS